MSKRKVARALIIFGIGLLAAGIAAVQFFGDSGMGGSELFIVWVLIQSSSYLVAGTGFVRVFMLNSDFLKSIPIEGKAPRVILTQAALVSAVAGLCLTFPLVQIGFPVPIATLFVAVGIGLFGLSLLLGLVALILPKETRLENLS